MRPETLREQLGWPGVVVLLWPRDLPVGGAQRVTTDSVDHRFRLPVENLAIAFLQSITRN